MGRWTRWLVILLLLAWAVPALAQEAPPGGEDPPGAEVNLLETLVFLSTLVAAAVELVKPGVKALPLSDGGHDLILRLLGFGFGVAFVMGSGSLNLLSLSPVYGRANPAIGQFLTGLIVGGFSQGIYLVGSGLFGKPIKPQGTRQVLRE